MIQFNELRITPNADRLIIEAELKQGSYFEEANITRILVSKITNIEGDELSIINKNIHSKAGDTPDLEITSDDFGKVKKIRLTIYNNWLDLDEKLRNAFIKVTVEVEPNQEIPEGQVNSVVTGYVVDLYPFYIKTLLNIKVLDSLCSNSDELVDCILKFKALELAFKTGNANLAKQYWFKYFDSNSNIYNRYFVNKNCYD